MWDLSPPWPLIDEAEPFWLRYFLGLGDDRAFSDSVGMNGSPVGGISSEEVDLISIGALSEGKKSLAFDFVSLILGITMVKSSAAFVGLCWGWTFKLTMPAFFDEFALTELVLAGLPIFVGPIFIVLAVFAGVFGLFIGLTAGLLGGVSVLAGFLVE